MSAAVDVSSLAVETPVAHLSTHRTPEKASSKSSQSPQVVDTRPTCPMFDFGLLSGNCRSVSYSTLRDGFQTREHEVAAELLIPRLGIGPGMASGVVGSNFLMTEDRAETLEYSKLLRTLDEQKLDLPELKLDLPEQKLDLPELKLDLPEQKFDLLEQKFDLPEQKSEQKFDLPEQTLDLLEQKLDQPKQKLAEICTSDKYREVSGVLKDDCKPSDVSSRLLIQHLTQSSAKVNNSTKNCNACSIVERGDKDTNNGSHGNEKVIKMIIHDDDSEDMSDKDEYEIECGECIKVFGNMQSYMDHTCCRIPGISKTPDFDDSVQLCPTQRSFSDALRTMDAVRFLGKIIFTPNGSAYVIEDVTIDQNSLTELRSSILHEEDWSGVCTDADMSPLSNVIFFPKLNSSLMTSLNQNVQELLERSVSRQPLYSYHVFDIDTIGITEILQIFSLVKSHQQIPQPALMCFICKLIFQKTASLLNHATCVHSVDVAEDKKSLLFRFNHSCICHKGGKEQPAQISLLFPMDDSSVKPRSLDRESISCRKKLAEFVTSKRFLDCESMLTFRDNIGDSLTPPNKISKTVENMMLQKHYIPTCGRKTYNSSSSVDAKHKRTKYDCLRVTSPAPSVMSGWYSLPSVHIPNKVTHTDCSTTSVTIISPSDTQPTSTYSFSPLSVTKVSSTASSTPSLSTPLTSTSHFAVFNDQTDDVFSTALTLSASNCLHLPGLSCTCDQLSPERIHSEDCPKYDMALDASLYLGYNSSLIHTRNSCKTLKCPKCNWHYKYQETLDIHMKEKHPETDDQCVYCSTNQNHPRLTRGESYVCGYKPYRCEVCNYSTTTKGNLSIHMQSDKHINNMQDLVSGTPACKMPSQHPHSGHPNMQDLVSGTPGCKMPSHHPHSARPPAATSPVSYHNSIMSLSSSETLSKRFKQKQFFRCDICNYDTSLARNLRIHMTSEKHTHNLLAVSRGINRFLQDATLNQINDVLPINSQEQSRKDSASRQHLPNSLLQNGIANLTDSEVSNCCFASQEKLGFSAQEDSLNPCERPSPSQEADGMFECCICNKYSADELKDVHNHIQEERITNENSNRHTSNIDGDYYCHLCSYQTPLKANLQLHCKTDKHLHKLQIWNHILEGGSGNEWKLSSRDFPWQIYCIPCGFYANSTHDMQLHVSGCEHDTRGNIFRHLQVLERAAPPPRVGSLRYYHCSLCSVNVVTKQQLLAHSRTPRHIHKEQSGTLPRAHSCDVYLLKEMAVGEVVDFLHEDDDNNTNCSDTPATLPDGCNNHSNTITTTSPATTTTPSATSPSSSTLTENTSTLCCSIDKNADLGGSLAFPESHDRVVQKIPEGANNEKTMKTLDVSLSSALTSGNNMSSVKAEIPLPSTTTFSSGITLTDTGTCSCSGGGAGYLRCCCSHHSNSPEIPCPEEEQQIVLCPLCRHDCRDTTLFEEHLVKEHHVTKEGMQRLMSLVSIPSSIPSAISPILSEKPTISLRDDDDHQISPSLSSSPLSASILITPKDEAADPVQCPVSTSQMIPSSKDATAGELASHPQLTCKTDATTNSFPGIQDEPPQATSHSTTHSTSSPQPSTVTSPPVMSSPIPETIPLISSLPTNSEATSNFSTQDEFWDIDLQLVETQLASIIATEGIDLTLQESLDRELENLFTCQTCSKPFGDIDRLYEHQNELGHLQLKQTPQGPGYLCWRKGCNQYFKTALTLQVHFREIHAKQSLAGILSPQEVELYSFRCEQCSFGFKSSSALEKHTCVHLIQSVTQCSVCSRKFSCKLKMKRHLETGHKDLSTADIKFQVEKFNKNIHILFTFPSFQQFTSLVLMTNDNVKSKVFSFTNQKKVEEHEVRINGIDFENNVNICENYVDTRRSGLEKCQEKQIEKGDKNKQSLAEENYHSKDCKFKCHPCMLGYADETDMLAHFKTSVHEYNEEKEIANVKVGPHKCDVRKESFRHESDFMEYCNSTGHQMKLKQQKVASGDNPPMITTTAAEMLLKSNVSGQKAQILQPSCKPQHNLPTSLLKANAEEEEAASGISLTSSARITSPSEISYVNEGDDTVLATGSSDMKSYKCNLCRVSFNNQSGYEIHLRSVYHRTRTNKLGGMTFSDVGSNDQTLSHNPDPQAESRLRAQTIADMIHQQATAQADPCFNLQSLQDMNVLTQLSLLRLLPISSHALLTAPAPNSLMAVSNAQMESCLSSLIAPFIKSDSVHGNASTSVSSGVLIPEIAETVANSARGEGSKSEVSDHGTQVIPDLSDTKTSTDVKMSRKNNELPPQFHAPVIARPRGFMGRFKPQLYKSLLENFGFEFVMHFNEEQTRTTEITEVKEDNLDKQDEYTDELTKYVEPNTDLTSEMKESTEKEVLGNDFQDNKNEKQMEASESNKVVELTEISRQQCQTCHKYFSNLWVLKNHEEEMHNLLVSPDTIDNFGQRFKEKWEKSLPKLQEQESGSLPAVNPPNTPAAPSAAEKSTTLDVVQAKSALLQPELPRHLELPQLLPFMTLNCLPMHLSMNLMNLGLQNSLMSSLMMPNMDFSQSFLSHTTQGSLMDSSLPASPQQFHISAAAAAAAQKRVRTRISDDQLKVLRQYFDINNSPTEEQVNKMADQTGLPQKVIKHWFRNTLFKERQRNKDSPYNFNNPPCTSIDLREYDRTGKLPEIKLEIDEDFDRGTTPAPDLKKETPSPVAEMAEDKTERAGDFVDNPSLKIHLTPKMELYTDERKDQESYSNLSSPSISSIPSTPVLSAPGTPTLGNTPNATNPLAYSLDSYAANIARIEAATFHNMGKRANRTRFSDYQIKTLQDYFEQNAYPKDDELEHLSKILGLSARVIVVWFQNARQKARKIYENQPENGSTKEAASHNQRTSGMNYQCKKCNSIFQRYYELNKHQKHFCMVESNNNRSIPSMMETDNYFSYSNDDSFFSDYQITPASATKKRDTQISSYPPKQQSVSNTTTCVIPTASASPSSASSPSYYIPSFKCDKCSMSFSRFETWQEHQRAHSIAPAMMTPFSSNPAFRMLENLAYQENDAPAVTTAALPTSSSILHSMVSPPATSSLHESPAMTLTPTSPSSSSLSPSKRKSDSEDDSGEQPKDKRLRTTILPEQLDYLYQQYQIDCNPSRKQLEHIASTVNLKKRVVQVWFQNTRARERKGHYRAHQQLINKRCPFCRALFRAKSALESHLATKHPEQVSKGDINIDLLPDAVIETPPGQAHTSMQSYFSHASSPLSSMYMASEMKHSPSGSMAALSNYMALMSASSGISLPFPGSTADINQSFEDPFFKKYMKDLNKNVSSKQEHSLLHSYNHLVTPETASIHSSVQAYTQATPTSFSIPSQPLVAHHSKITPQPLVFSSNDDAPLDLSKPIKTIETLSNEPALPTIKSASVDYSDRTSEKDFLQRQSNLDDSFSETQSEMADHEYTNDAGNSPQSPPHTSNSFIPNAGSSGHIGKRYRTQMSAVQVRVMKHLFKDYKTPTMVECEFLGQEIGLPKRVVQVWFQNARAKEKKARLSSGKSLSPEADLTKSPEECYLCRCKYTHKFTLQDHIFTKAHIDKIKSFLNSQGDLDSDLNNSNLSGLFQSPDEADHMDKRWDSSVSSLQTAKLQPTLVNPAGFSSAPGQGERCQKSHEKVPTKKGKTEDTISRTEQKQKQAVLEMAMNAQMFSALGGYMPGLDPAYLPYMYSGGVPGYYPGMGLPLVQPGIIPDHMMPYDPLVFGTPLALLQIPSAAKTSISEKVKEPGSVLARYTQDSQVLADLHKVVRASDLTVAAEATLDVGFICKTCQTVYPMKDSCIAHQRSFCMTNALSLPKGFEPIMKLEQIQYECRACDERYSTVLEFKSHCQQESHKQKLTRFKVKEAARHETADSPSSSGPYVPFPGKVSSSVSSYLSKPQTTSSLFNNNSISQNNNQVKSPAITPGMKLPLLPSLAHQYNKVSPGVPAAFTDKHTAAFTEVPDIHEVKAE